MCRNLPSSQLAAIQVMEQRARLTARNKEAAKEQLLAIQLLLAKRVASASTPKK